MSEESIVSIIVPIITGVLAVLGSFVGNYAIALKKSREQAIKDAEREQAQKDQLQMILEEQKKIKSRLDTHNGYAEKFAETTNKLNLLQKDVEYIKGDIQDLKKIPMCKIK